MQPPHPTTTPGSLLVDTDLEALLGNAIRAEAGAPSVDAAQIQPASLDLRLGRVAYRLRAGFLPGGESVAERVERLCDQELSLDGDGALFERGLVYLVQLEEQLELPPDVRARFNPRSSTGRCDLFTRVLTDGHPRFDEAPAGYRGKLWMEVSPLSFPAKLKRGDRLGQLRLVRGVAALTTEELRELYDRTPLCFEGERPLAADEVRFDEEGGIELRVGLSGRDPSGWRAAEHTGTLEFAKEGAHAREEYWEAVHAPEGRCILSPGSFYIFASQERLRVPPTYAAEMLPVDVGIGELRNNYAGFFDNGFGWREDADGVPVDHGTPAVLEVRAHDVPFLVEDGQVFCRLKFFRTGGRPRRLYGVGRGVGGSYQEQDLTLARVFRG